MKKIAKSLLFCFLMYFPLLAALAQETATFRNPEQKFNTAIELYQKKDFSASKDLFQDLVSSLQEDSGLIKTTSEYYLILCAIELHQPNVKERIEEFIHTYPSYSQTPLIYYQLGKLEFKSRKYDDALNAFKRVNPNDLTSKEREEFNFRMGFIYVKKEDTDKAKTYFDQIDDNSDSKYAHAANYYKAHINYLEGNYDEALPVFEKLRKDRTYKRAVPFYIIQIYYKKGEYDKILSIGPSLLKDASSSRKAEIAKLIGDAYYREDNFDKAAEYLEIYQSTNRQQLSRNDYYQLGVTNFKTHNYKRAIKQFEQVITEEDSLSQNAQYHLAQSYMETNQKKFAANAFLSAYKMNFDKEISEESLFKYIELSKNLPNNPYNESISLLENYIQTHPNSKGSDRAYTLLIDLFYSTKNYKAALESIEKLNLNSPKLKEAYQQIAYSRAIELFNQKNYKEALELFTKARKYPVDRKIYSESVFWTAEAFYRDKNYWGAQKYYLQFIDMAEAKNLDEYNLAHYNLAYVYYKRKNYTQAVQQYNTFVNFPGRVNSSMESDAFLRIGDCYFISKQYQQAINSYNQAISTNSGDQDYAWYQKSQAYGALSQLGEKDNALKELVRKYPKSPLYDDALYDLGTTNLLRNNNSEALKWYDMLIQNRPKSPFARKSLLKTGLIYYNRGNNKESIGQLKKVVNDYPASSEAKEALTTLRNIYVEENKVDDYVKFTDNLEYIQVSPTEQDSLSFTAAENLYAQQKCDKAIPALEAYLKRFEKGAYLLKANYYLADCLLKSDRFDEAKDNLRFIINYPNNPYTLLALERVAPVEYNNENYDVALKDYQKMQELAGNKKQIVDAIEGQMECNFKLKNYKQAAQKAKELLTTEKIDQEQMVKAHLIQAKSEYELGNLKAAYREFKITSGLTSGDLAPESLYYMAYINYKEAKYKDAENTIFDLAEKYASYDYWIGKSFILLSDVYIKMGNLFQAEQTLQSIIDNYPKEDLKSVARKKLQQINKLKEKQQQEKKENTPEEEPIIVK
ncbi:MAG: tetratricopeptide repeat protein [Bacteroidales bacterium]